MNKWDQRFLQLAELVAGWSKDPSTKCGAVIVDAKKRVVGIGYNGFPRGVKDTPARYEDRDFKLAAVVHAEQNSLLNSSADTDGCSMYVWPMPPCSQCAAKIIQAGIVRVVSPAATPEQMERWGKSFEIAATMLDEAEVIRLQWRAEDGD